MITGVRTWPRSHLIFEKLDNEVADLLESLHHHQMPGSFYDYQLPVTDPFRDATATDPPGAPRITAQGCGTSTFEAPDPRSNAAFK